MGISNPEMGICRFFRKINGMEGEKFYIFLKAVRSLRGALSPIFDITPIRLKLEPF